DLLPHRHPAARRRGPHPPPGRPDGVRGPDPRQRRDAPDVRRRRGDDVPHHPVLRGRRVRRQPRAPAAGVPAEGRQAVLREVHHGQGDRPEEGAQGPDLPGRRHRPGDRGEGRPVPRRAAADRQADGRADRGRAGRQGEGVRDQLRQPEPEHRRGERRPAERGRGGRDLRPDGPRRAAERRRDVAGAGPGHGHERQDEQRPRAGDAPHADDAGGV
ncbi:MAG: RuvA, partial [uncultured Phycisphaerae bacterium]